MLDTGAVNDTTVLHEAVRRWRPDTPLRAAVFSHHHVDHIFGLAPFEREADEHHWGRPLVYGHAGLAGNFDRYKKTLGWNTAINKRQFAIAVDRFRWPENYRYPDVTYEKRASFRSGSLTFELHHGLGETDDATWTFVPERKILHPGDLFIWAAPNAGNPQKVQRYAGEWATALREMAGTGAEIMVSGPRLAHFRRRPDPHRPPRHGGAARGHRVPGAGADEYGRHARPRPPRSRDAGASARQAVPAPVYDHPQFIVRNVWRLYGGWYDGEPDNLLPAPRAEQAREWVALAGGINAVLERAGALQREGNLRMACHLVEFAVIAEPGSKAAHALRAEVYGARSKLETASMSQNILNHAALASAQGKRDLAGDF